MPNEQKILDMKIKTRIQGRKVKYTLREYCHLREIPENIMLWRLSKNFSPQKLYARPCHILEYNGVKYTPAMLAENVGITDITLINRWCKGLRGEKLVAAERPYHELRSAEDTRAVLKEECREQLIALCRAHPERIREAYRRSVEKELEPFDEAQARRNAQRLEAATLEIRTLGLEIAA